MNYINFLEDNSFVIFLFHGVVEKNNYAVRNYNRKHIEKDYFFALLKKLKANGNPVSMEDIVNLNYEGKKLPPKSFAITFDDGFENNFSLAAPILADLNIPATFYLTTSFIDENRMSWIDRIEYCFEETVKGEVTLDEYDAKFSFSSKEEKIRVLEFLREKVKKDISIDVNRLVSKIYLQLGKEEIIGSDDPLGKKMNWKQVAALSSESNFIIGGHTHTHANLAFTSDDEMENEISTSLSLLEKRGKIKPNHYSYPEGLEHCFSDKVISVLKKYKIDCCPTAIQGSNSIEDDLFRLKRIQVI